jgi:hypothetical protein
VSILPEEFSVHSFRCPNCKEFISSDAQVCRFCSFTISAEVRDEAIRHDLDTKRQQDTKRAKNTMTIGIVFLVSGLLATAIPVFESYAGYPMINVSCFIPFMIIGGLGTAMYGFNDYRKARNSY